MTTPPDTGDKQPQVNPHAQWLRELHDSTTGYFYSFEEAADEIDALSAKCAALEAENTRLRKALKRVQARLPLGGRDETIIAKALAPYAPQAGRGGVE